MSDSSSLRTNSPRLGIVTPFMREQVRWALSSYKENEGVGVPRIRNQIIDVLGESVETQISNQDIYNFLGKKVRTEAYKIRLIHAFLNEVFEDYVSSPDQHTFRQKMGDFVSGFANSLDIEPDRHGFQEGLIDALDGALFCALSKQAGNYGDPDLTTLGNYYFDGVGVRCIFFSYPGFGRHIDLNCFRFRIPESEISNPYDLFHQNLSASGSEVSREVQSYRHFSGEEFEAAIGVVESHDFAETPISDRLSGIVLGGIPTVRSEIGPAHLCMMSGVEPGIMMRNLMYIGQDNRYGRQMVELGKPIGTNELCAEPDDPRYVRSTLDFSRFFSTDPFLTSDEIDEMRGYIAIKNESIENFIEKLQWFDVL